MQAKVAELRDQITSLIDELDHESRSKEHIERHKSNYKSKLKLANQRIRHICESFDQMAILIYQRVVSHSFDKQFASGEGLDTLAVEINNLEAAIKLQEERLMVPF